MSVIFIQMDFCMFAYTFTCTCMSLRGGDIKIMVVRLLFEILVLGGNSLFNTLSFFINDIGIMLCGASLFPFTIVYKITLHK